MPRNPAQTCRAWPTSRSGTRRHILFGKYELLSRINVGGMAEIVLAKAPKAPSDTTPAGDRLVAIKRILPHLCSDAHYKAMFMDESRVLAQLDHPSIIHAYEFGEIDGTPFIALEYVQGQDAREVFHACLRQGQPLPIGLACYVIARVCEGLQHAHDQTDVEGRSLGVVHRDVSLQNILVGYDGAVKLTDFGIAVSSENIAQTEAGVVKGKFGYMSPEQVQGVPLDRRSDVFGAGICLYELLTGERLFSGESNYRAVERVRNVAIEPPSHFNRQIPASLERVVLKALARQPSHRYQSTNDLRRALQSFLSEARLFLEREDLSDYMRALFAPELAAGQDQAPQPLRPLSAAPPVVRVGNVTAVQNMSAGGLFDASEDEPTQVVMPGMRHRPPPSLAPSRHETHDGDAPDAGWRGDAATGLSAFDHVPPVNPVPEATPSASRRPINHRATAQFAPVITTARPPQSLPPASRTGQSLPVAARTGHTLPPPPRISGVPARAAPSRAPASRTLQSVAPVEHEPTASTELDAEPVPAVDPRSLAEDAHASAAAEHAAAARSGMYAPAEPDAALHPSEASTPYAYEPPAFQAPTAPPANLRSLPTLELPKSRELRILPLVLAAVVGLVVAASTVYIVRGRAVGDLRVETEPPNARVLVDGQPAATSRSPYLFPKLTARRPHTVIVESEGYTSWSTTLYVTANRTVQLPLIKLEPSAVDDHEPQRDPPPPADAIAEPSPESQDRRAPSTSTAAAARREAARAKREAAREKRAEAKARRDGARAEKRAEAKAKREQTRARRAEAATSPRSGREEPSTSTSTSSAGGMGTLRINTRPWSQVTIDGTVIGNTPLMNIPLPAGKHTVVLSNREFGVSKSVIVTIAPGETVTRVLTLTQ
ncbi:MAG: protein kinase [Polyangiales bacterium]